MDEYIERSAAVAIADYAEDEHPYDKDPKRPDTYSAYNEGWSAACDYIRGRLEGEPAADVDPVRHGRWMTNTDDFTPNRRCSVCGYNKPIVGGERVKQEPENYCPNCGAKMDTEGSGER